MLLRCGDVEVTSVFRSWCNRDTHKECEPPDLHTGLNSAATTEFRTNKESMTAGPAIAPMPDFSPPSPEQDRARGHLCVQLRRKCGSRPQCRGCARRTAIAGSDAIAGAPAVYTEAESNGLATDIQDTDTQHPGDDRVLRYPFPAATADRIQNFASAPGLIAIQLFPSTCVRWSNTSDVHSFPMTKRNPRDPVSQGVSRAFDVSPSRRSRPATNFVTLADIHDKEGSGLSLEHGPAAPPAYPE